MEYTISIRLTIQEKGKLKIALAPDWASDTKDSDKIGALIKSMQPEYTT